jgi:hypothetical protein
MRIVLGRLRRLLRQRLLAPIGVRRPHARSLGSQRMLLLRIVTEGLIQLRSVLQEIARACVAALWGQRRSCARR